MIKRNGTPNAHCGINAAADRSLRPAPLRHSSFVIRHFPRGLTLIELLVTIVIMVTVLAGVLPLVSPNNNSRKLREASRQLNSLLSQAQAQAARDGRPVGVAFREVGTPGSYRGMAIEAYTIAVPPTYAGFSEHSRVEVRSQGDLTYGTGGVNPNLGTSFRPQFEGKPVCQLQFLAFANADPFPPRMLRIGDTIEVAGNSFLICDDDKENDMPNKIELVGDTKYLLSDPSAPAPAPGTFLNAIWTNYTGGMILPQTTTPPSGQAYKIYRQPTNSSEQPLQFPRGIGIDLEASGADGLNVPMSLDNAGATTVGLMFSPNGSLQTLIRNNERFDGVEQVFLLMGLFENGNDGTRDPASYDYDFASTTVDNDELSQRRTRINWLNADCRWVSVNRAGRIITAENNISFDPRTSPYIDEPDPDEQQEKQIASARNLAKQMSGSTGR